MVMVNKTLKMMTLLKLYRTCCYFCTILSIIIKLTHDKLILPCTRYSISEMKVKYFRALT